MLCIVHTISAGRYAVIVGCNSGGPTVNSLTFAQTDAHEFAGILKNLGDFDEHHICLLEGTDSSSLTRQLAWADSLITLDRDPQGMFLFYYSGHADEENLMLGNQKFSLKKLKTILDAISSSIQIDVFDACNSGSVTALKGGKRLEPLYFQEKQTIKGHIIIASSAATESAQESKSFKGSIFSHHWFNALRGSADLLGNGRITVDEAYQYAYRKTIETTALIAGEVQHPVFKFDILGQGDIVLTSLSKSESGVVFDNSCKGKFLVLSEDYLDVFADFSKKAGTETFIALPQGSYTVINANGNEIATCVIALGKGAFRMNKNLLTQSPITALQKKGPAPNADSAENESTPLSVYSWGLGARFLLSYSGNNKTSELLSALSFKNLLFLNTHGSLFFNFYYMFPGVNAAGDMGFDYLFNGYENNHDYSVGGGFGMYYLEKSGNSFSRRLEAALTVHGGYSINVGKQIQLCLQVPYTVIIGSMVNHQIGLELSCIFSGPYKNVKVLHP